MMRVLGDRVLVALPPKPDDVDTSTGYAYQNVRQTASGLFVAATPKQYNLESATRGIVVQLGQQDQRVNLADALALFVEDGPIERSCGHDLVMVEDAESALARLAPAPFEVSVGDCVVFPPNVGEQLDQDGISYLILREADIVGILQPSGREAEWLIHLKNVVNSAQMRAMEEVFSE